MKDAGAVQASLVTSGNSASVEELPTVIVGAGLAGISTAQALASRGVRTLLIDIGAEIANGSSHANAGMLTSSMSDPWNSPGIIWQVVKSAFTARSPLKIRPTRMLASVSWGLSFLRRATSKHYDYASRMNFRLARYSLEKTRALRVKLDLNFDSGSRGSLKIFDDRTAFDRSIRMARLLSEEGLNYSLVKPQEIIQLEPLLADKIHTVIGGIFFPDDELGDANKFSQEMFSDLKKHRGEVLLNTRVCSFIEKEGQVVGVQTTSGPIHASCVIIAAGHASVGLLRQCRINLPIRPVKGYSVTYECDAQSLPRLPVIDDAQHMVVTTLGSRLRISGIAELAGDDTSIDESRVNELIRALDTIYPSLRDRLDPDSFKAWAGLRPVSADGLPFIGGTKKEGLFVNTGHGHLGWTMAAGSGQLIADHILGIPTEIDIKPFRVGRRA